MNAKETYRQMYSKLRRDSSRIWLIENGYGTQMETKAVITYRTTKAISPMAFRQFIDCLEAAQTGRAYATRNHWFFIVDGDELQFSKEECARFARYFSEGFHMNSAQYSKIIKAGGCYINERLFEDDEVFPLKPERLAYSRFIIGKVDKRYTLIAPWIIAQRISRLIPTQADYVEQQADWQAELSMQRYGG